MNDTVTAAVIAAAASLGVAAIGWLGKTLKESRDARLAAQTRRREEEKEEREEDITATERAALILERHLDRLDRENTRKDEVIEDQNRLLAAYRRRPCAGEPDQCPETED